VKQKDGCPSIQSIIADPIPKLATHFSLKALAYKGYNAFDSYSHIDLNFIMMAYTVQLTRGSKKSKREKLLQTLKTSDTMSNPGKLTQDEYNKLKSRTPTQEGTHRELERQVTSEPDGPVSSAAITPTDTAEGAAGGTTRGTVIKICLNCMHARVILWFDIFLIFFNFFLTSLLLCCHYHNLNRKKNQTGL
jgi:Flp pilus assembly protein TadB